jgi:hypothetical protein
MNEALFEFDPAVARALERYAPLDAENGDWEALVTHADGRRAGARRVLALSALAVAAALVLALATPLGGALRQVMADFSRWLTGTPGSPVSEEEQKAFDDANARSWIAFPGSPKLRRLTSVVKDGVTYDLVGFRSADSLCIRVVTSGEVHDRRLTCAPVEELRNDDVPVRVLLADWLIGRGDKREQIGFDTYTSAYAQVTTGIAADGVKAVELIDDHGSHEVAIESNAFLYVAERPEVGQRVTSIRAQLDNGGMLTVPFTVQPFATGGGFGGASGDPGGPTRVERVVSSGEIGWFERREERGAPIDDTLRARFHNMFGGIAFGRVLTPDPNSRKRVAITTGGSLPGGPARTGLCETLLGDDGTAGGGCLGRDFAHGPFSFGYSVTGGGDQYATFAGVASDDVARLQLFTATGNQIEVPLHDNAYLADVALARLPAKMVGYDGEGRVIGIQQTPPDEGAVRLIPKPILHFAETVAGVGTLEMLVNKTREGGQCWSTKGTGKVRVRAGSCIGAKWTFAPLRVGPIPDPPVFVYGRVRDDIKTLTLRYADGRSDELTPREQGYVLSVIPERQRQAGHRLVEIIGRGGDGHVVAREAFTPR